MTPNFKDHFSNVAKTYASYRPQYPAELYVWLADISPTTELVWDCACGTGQASLGLAKHFQKVIATDASAQQIAAAEPHPKIEWRVAAAEISGLADHSVDLITVAQALHWFDLGKFYAEAQRVLKPQGVLAVWTYGVLQIAEPRIDALAQNFYSHTVDPYWPPERKIVETGYRDLAFPFQEFPAPAFSMQLAWSKAQLMGYFRSWSATDRYIKVIGSDPVSHLEQQLAGLWDDETSYLTAWPLAFRIGRKHT
ncbi:class I SAM-dependent methyltransferase [uncultured Thiothrix sp.]|uniref:class I SAM-dependent methyltransferase n=1 Tax=uncultured Thiothrix sp. TaxID=223185 RepID=UPI0026086DC4|nr:class I SAM-dependent methyltransferase [uncultured Thiothrix sp.]HMT94892.1 class I SAM-dependent methyltransferase [Thiolinea sp.]